MQHIRTTMKWTLLLSTCAITLGIPQHQLHLHMTEDERADLLGAAPFHETPEYDLTTPFTCDVHGAPHSRIRRETRDFVYFKVSAFEEEYHLQVKHNVDLLAPGFFVQVAGQDGQPQMHFDTFEPCHFTGQLKSHSPSHVAVSDCDGLTGLIATNSTQLLLQPLPDHLVNSLGNEARHTHLIYKRDVPVINSSKSTEVPERSLNVSRCSVEGSIPPSYYNESKPIIDRPPGPGEPIPDEKRKRYVVEGFVVTDSGMYEKHGTQLKRYVVTLMNIASSMYNYYALGYNVRLVLTRIYMFPDKQTEEKQDLFITRDSKRNLENFSRWQSDPERYIADDNDPLHYDHAFLFISKGMCYGSDEDCWELGRAWIGSVCSRRGLYAASVNADKGLQLGFVFAHELGHNLGMYHDGTDGQCSAADGYIMTPSTAGAKQMHLWSKCSKTYLLDNLRDNTRTRHLSRTRANYALFLGKNGLACLADCPELTEMGFGHTASYMLPGKIYDKDTQCQLAFPGSPGSCLSFNENICQSIWCKSPSNSRSCVGASVGAADGTRCGQPNKICYHRQCVPDNSIIPPPLPSPTLCSGESCTKDLSSNTIDGGWADWERQTPCSRTCGGGLFEQRRKCTNPSPQNCGDNCKGESTRIAVCNTHPCPDDTCLDYRAVQCAAHNSRMRVTDLLPTSLYVQNQPCRLLCFSASKRTHYFGTDVEDGTKCDQYSNNRCYRGDCQTVGCNDQLGSTLQFDYCGCCGGNNSTCTVITGSYTTKPTRSGYYPVTVIPAGARRIRVEEIHMSIPLYFAAKVNGKRFLGVTLAKYDLKNISGTVIEYHRPSDGPEVLVAAGPTTDDIQLEALIYARSGPLFGLQYTYAIHSASAFVWKAEAFGTCTATCGDGVQTRKVTCRCSGTLEKTSAWNCAHLVEPPTSQSCNTFPCAHWVTSQWSSCPVTCGRGYQTRTRECITSVKTVRCPRPKPRQRIKCNLGGCP